MIQSNVNLLILSDFIDQWSWNRPIGPYRIASEVRKHSYSCQIIECFTDFSQDELFNILETCVGSDTLAVGLSSTFFNFISHQTNNNLGTALASRSQANFSTFTRNYPLNQKAMQKIFKKVKKINAKTKIILGGAKALFLDAPGVDAFVQGYADMAIIEYLKWLQNQNPFFQFERNDKSQIVINGNAINEKFDFKNQSDVQYLPQDNILKKEILSIEVSRGCIFSCKFCARPLIGKKNDDYIKDKNLLRSELVKNYEVYGTTKYTYSDETLNDNITKLKMLAEIKQSLPFDLEFSSYLRIDLLNRFPEQYQLLKDAGLKAAIFGVESLYHPALRAVGKGLHPNKVVNELYKFKDYFPNVGTQSGFIVGLPYETRNTVQSWVDKIIDHNFPLDTLEISELFLFRNSKNLYYKSDFDVNWRKYYTFSWDSDVNWHNGDFDWEWAKKYCQDVNFEIGRSNRRRVGGRLTFNFMNIDVWNHDYTKVPMQIMLSIKDWKYLKKRYRQKIKQQILSDQPI